MKAIISYGHSEEGWSDYEAKLKSIIEENNFKKICEVGGGANPQLSIDYVVKNGLDYTILDSSREELNKASAAYQKIEADICSRDIKLGEKFDFIFSKMLAEHIRDGSTLHKNIFELLSPGGMAFHFFPTLFNMPFLVNKIVSENLSSFIIDLFDRRDRYKHEKFPAYYDWCQGPTKRQIKRFENIGYAVMEYKGFFGHGYYRNIPLANQIQHYLADFLVGHAVPFLTTYCYLILRKAT